MKRTIGPSEEVLGELTTEKFKRDLCLVEEDGFIQVFVRDLNKDKILFYFSFRGIKQRIPKPYTKYYTRTLVWSAVRSLAKQDPNWKFNPKVKPIVNFFTSQKRNADKTFSYL